MRDFGFEVMRVDVRAQLDFLNLVRVLAFAVLLLTFFEFVFIFAELDLPADGRIGIRGDLDEVDSLIAGQDDGVA